MYASGVIVRTEIMAPAIVPGVGNDAVLPGQGGESYGIANSLGQSGPHRPKADANKRAIRRWHDTEGFGLGTHQAVDSGFKVYEKVIKMFV